MRAAVAAALAGLLVVLGLAAGASAAGYPTLPLADDRGLLGNLSGPTLAPSGIGSIDFTVGNPLAVEMTAVELTLQLYAFNAFPGNATSTISVASAPVLSNATSSGASVGVSVGALRSLGVYHGFVNVVSSGTTPTGTFAVRTALSFTANGTDYLFESRGWFTAPAWAAATSGPNGSATVNLTVLGVSGVLPETAVLVSASSFPIAILLVLVGAGLLIAAGAALYFRRDSVSSSGARKAAEDHQASSAFGNSRTSDGD
ncbi:MAG: hypothetical protein ACRECT_06095 [Thermoplasmata archaeon]